MWIHHMLPSSAYLAPTRQQTLDGARKYQLEVEMARIHTCGECKEQFSSKVKKQVHQNIKAHFDKS